MFPAGSQVATLTNAVIVLHCLVYNTPAYTEEEKPKNN